MELDRKYQLEILQTLAKHWEDPFDELQKLFTPGDKQSYKRYVFTLWYLDQHGLIDAKLDRTNNGYYVSAVPEITGKGMDFLANDGGLSAILGTVTVKLHADTLRDLIAAKIDRADLTPADKRKWTDALQSLPAESIKHLATKLIDLALDKGQDAIAVLATYLGGQ